MTTTTQYPSQPQSQFDPNMPLPQGPAPKKKHTVRNLVIASIALVAVVGGCSALAGGSSDLGATDLTATTSDGQAAKSAEKTTAGGKDTEQAKPTMTKSQEEALEAAQSYVDTSGFSQKGLMQQLTSKYGSDFSKADATFAVKHVSVDWNTEAVEAAKSYLDSGSFSKKGLEQQLTSKNGSQFTDDQAAYALKHADADYNAEAVEAAESYLESGSFSRQSLLNQLTSQYGSQFTKAQAQHAVDQVGI